MKKLYYGLLALGTLAGMQSLSYGCAAPAKPMITKKTENLVGQTRTTYQKKNYCEFGLIGTLTCSNNEQTKEIQCTFIYQSKDGTVKGEHWEENTFYELKKEYEEQQNLKATKQVPGGNMIPNPAGRWMPQPEPKDTKSDK